MSNHLSSVSKMSRNIKIFTSFFRTMNIKCCSEEEPGSRPASHSGRGSILQGSGFTCCHLPLNTQSLSLPSTFSIQPICFQKCCSSFLSDIRWPVGQTGWKQIYAAGTHTLLSDMRLYSGSAWLHSTERQKDSFLYDSGLFERLKNTENVSEMGKS